MNCRGLANPHLDDLKFQSTGEATTARVRTEVFGQNMGTDDGHGLVAPPSPGEQGLIKAERLDGFGFTRSPYAVHDFCEST